MRMSFKRLANYVEFVIRDQIIQVTAMDDPDYKIYIDYLQENYDGLAEEITSLLNYTTDMEVNAILDANDVAVPKLYDIVVEAIVEVMDGEGDYYN